MQPALKYLYLNLYSSLCIILYLLHYTYYINYILYRWNTSLIAPKATALISATSK